MVCLSSRNSLSSHSCTPCLKSDPPPLSGPRPPSSSWTSTGFVSIRAKETVIQSAGSINICRSCRASWKLLEVVCGCEAFAHPAAAEELRAVTGNAVSLLRPLAEFSSRAGRLRGETAGSGRVSLSATFWTLTVSVVTQRLGWLSCVVIGCVVCSQTLAASARRPCAPSCHQVRYPAGAPNTSPFSLTNKLWNFFPPWFCFILFFFLTKFNRIVALLH